MQDVIFVLISVVTHSSQTPQIYPSQFVHQENTVYESMEACEDWLRFYANRASVGMRLGIDHTNSIYAEDISLPIHLRCVEIEL